jgi:hypothetical protein
METVIIHTFAIIGSGLVAFHLGRLTRRVLDGRRR